MSKPVILFDGMCNLCHGFVQFVIRRDPQAQFRFAALQSEAGQSLLAAHGLAPAALADPESVVLVADGRLYSHSTAVLRIARRLGWGWRLLAAPGWLLPRSWRDALYRYVARHRYRWFGRQESCWLPTPALKKRFL